MRRFVLGIATFAAAMVVSAGSARADIICTSCAYTGPAGGGTYIGTYDPTNNDEGAFIHQNVTNGTSIDDRWVFDIAPIGNGSLAANFTAASAFSGFTGALYQIGALSDCASAPGTVPSTCATVNLGGLVGADTNGGAAVETGILLLPAGRYVFQILGTAAGPSGFGSYNGTIATFITPVPEPALLTLLAVGLGVAARRRRRLA